MKYFLGFVALFLTIVYIAGGGFPRLMGTGCDNRPLGIAFAIEESDFSTNCRAIVPLFSREIAF